jgi:TolA-binding protein
VSHADLHPEDLLDRERQGTLGAEQRRLLDEHLASCPACALHRRVVADFASEARPREGDGATLRGALERALGSLPAAGSRAPAEPRRFARASRLLLLAAALLVAGAAAAGIVRAVRSPGRTKPAGALEPAPAPAASVARRTASAGPAVAAAQPAPDLELGEVAPAIEPVRTPAGSAASSAASTTRGADSTPVAHETTAPELFSRANEARRAGRRDEAARLYAELVRRFPASREARMANAVLGQMSLDDRDPATALQHFDSYLGEPRSGAVTEDVLAGRAQALMRLGRPAEERAAWQALLAAYPGSVHAARARERLRELR